MLLKFFKKPTDFYIDLGTTSTLIYAKSTGVRIHEPTLLVANKSPESPLPHLSYGDIAKKMVGKMPHSLTPLFPLKEGVISDFESTLQLLNFFLKKAGGIGRFPNSKMLISLPYDVTRHEKTAVLDLGKSLGSKNIQLVNEPMLAAIGAGVDVLKGQGNIIVDIGGGTTEVAIISLGGIVVSSAKRIGGFSLDEAIIHHLQSKYHFLIGEQTAEKLKIQVGNALNPRETSYCEVGGIDLKCGLPRRLQVNSLMILEPIESFLKDILALISKSLEDCPPELSGDIVDQGIILSGGGSLLNGLVDRIAEETGLCAKLSESPLYAVPRGGAKLIENPNFLDILHSF